MTITSGASPGVQVNSAAKDSTGAASVLATQAAALSNEIIVPDAITANNEGNLESSPVYPGRLVELREGATGVADGVVIAGGGTGYVVDEIITLTGGTAARQGRLRVTAISGGVITAAEVDGGSSEVAVGRDRGEYSVEPGNPVSQGSSSGSGTGATFTLTFQDVDETRYITADTSLTLTVHEDWIDGPANGENWRISYIIQDAATVTGLGLIIKRVADYSSSRRFQVMSGGWIAFLDGVSLETRDNSSTTIADFTINSDGRFDNGYLVSATDTSVSGGYMIGTPAVNGEMVFNCAAGGILRAYDWFLTCVAQNLVRLEGDVLMRDCKLFSASYEMDINPVGTLFWRDVVIEGKGATTDVINIGVSANTPDIDGFTLINTNGFSLDNADTITLRNGLFLSNNLRFLEVGNSSVFNIVNPVWSPDRVTQGDIDFTQTSSGVVNELFEVDVIVTDTAGSPQADAVFHILERLTADDIVDRFVTLSDGVFNNDITVSILEPDGTASGIDEIVRNNFVARSYKWLFEPFLSNLGTLAAKVELTAAVPSDLAIVETTQATAITGGGNAYVEFHEGDRLDEGPMKAIAYTGGTGTLPSLTAGRFPVLGANLRPEAWVGNQLGTSWAASTIPVWGASQASLDIKRGKDVWCAVGVSGRVATAPWNDATTWTNRSFASLSVDANGLTYVPSLELFIAVGNGGAIETSPDGTTWTARTSGVTTNLEDVTYGGGTVMAVGDNGTVVTSVNGTSWTDRTISTTDDFTDLAYVNGWWMATRSTLLIYWRSNDDGVTWEDVSPSTGETPLSTKSYNGMFVGPSSVGDEIKYSRYPLESGIDWPQVDIAQAGNPQQAIMYGGGLWVTGPASSPSSTVYTSRDFKTWTSRSVTGSAGAAEPTRGDYGVNARIRGQTSGAEGYVRDIIGDNASGTVLLERWNGIAFTDGESIQDMTSGGTWDANADVTGSFDAEYTGIVDVDAKTAQAAYDWQMAKFGETDADPDLNFRRAIVWGATDATKMISAGTAGFFTNRSAVNAQGVWISNRGAGTYEKFVADDGTEFLVPATVTLQVTVRDSDAVVVEGARVRIELVSDGSLILQGTTNASGIVSDSFSYTSDLAVLTKVRLKGFKNFRTAGTITSSGLFVGATLQDDTVVDLP